MLFAARAVPGLKIAQAPTPATADRGRAAAGEHRPSRDLRRVLGPPAPPEFFPPEHHGRRREGVENGGRRASLSSPAGNGVELAEAEGRLNLVDWTGR